MRRRKTLPAGGFGDMGVADLFAGSCLLGSPAEASDVLRAPPKSTTGVSDSHFHNHRSRLHESFLSAGPGSLADYEILELVLFRAIPRRDVKPLAKKLLDMLGDYNGVIFATPERLCEVQGQAAICELKGIEATAHRLARARVLNRPVLSS